MRLQWSSRALSDLVRLHEFLAAVNKPAAARVVKSLTAATAGLVANPRIGEKLNEFEPGEVRRILVGHYEMRYEIVDSTIFVLRLWHTREER
jgi:plasmid stabilization system protein ParE